MKAYLDTYKKKNLALLLAFILVLVLSYVLFFHPTLRLANENKTIVNELSELENSTSLIENRKSEIEKLNQTLGINGNTANKSQHLILNYVNTFCNTSEVFIKAIPQTIYTDNTGYIIETNVIELQGEYKNMLELLYFLEYETNVCRVSSAHFSKSKDLRSHQEVLTMTLYLQNIKMNS